MDDDICLEYKMWPIRQNGLTGFAAKCCLKDICECELKYAFDLQQKVLGERRLMLISITSLWHRDIDGAMDDPLIRDFWESVRREELNYS